MIKFFGIDRCSHFRECMLRGKKGEEGETSNVKRQRSTSKVNSESSTGKVSSMVNYESVVQSSQPEWFMKKYKVNS